MKRALRAALLCVITLCLLAGAALAGSQDSMPFTPKKKPAGGKWRIGYLEGGPYIQYQLTLRATVLSLAKLGWISPIEIPDFADPEDTAEMWKFLSSKVKSDFLEFVDDAHYSSNWDDKLRPETAKKVMARLATEKPDLDLIIAMGTWAGQDLANSKHHVPTEVMSTSNPLDAKIIVSLDDSGLDHLHARVDPDRYKRQVRLFNDIVGFHRLGIVYEDTVAGRSYAAVDDVEQVAKERGFTIVPCTTPLDVPDSNLAYKNLQTCHDKLADKVDALYLTENGGMRTDRMPQLLAPIFKNKIPTFSQAGSDDVRYGVLLSIAQAGFKYVGEYHAKIIGQILNGASPRKLSMIFEDPPKIAINLKTAELIGFDPPVDILMAADEIYENIEKAKPAQ
jgi:ABC-type uncharacterized transport system substrate-binding protein